MIKFINPNTSKKQTLPFLDDKVYKAKFNKGWSWSYVYNFSELRNTYIALREWDSKHFDLKSFFQFCEDIKLPFVKTPWNKRRILEQLNALKNFGLISDEEKIIKRAFENQKINSPISKEDLEVFEEIFFEYYRFKEILNWFLPFSKRTKNELIDYVENLKRNFIIEESNPLFFFSDESRFVDSFFHNSEECSEVYKIPKGNEDLMRFWDVFIKWGTSLEIIEKINLKHLEIKTNKSVSVAYLIRNSIPNFNLVEFISENFSTNYIHVPELVFKIAVQYRLSIPDIHKLIISQYKIQKEFISFERTSEIFIKKQEIKSGERILFPKYKSSYIAYIILRK